MKTLKVAMIAPVWLTVPARGYGGIESMLHYLCRGLQEEGVRVELFTVRGSKTPASRYHWLYEQEQYSQMTKTMYDAAAIPAAHLLAAIDAISRAGNFDVIHDHNILFGPMLLRDRNDLPPVLHTLHGPFNDARRIAEGYVDTVPLYRQLAGAERLYFNGISRAQLADAPRALRPRLVGAIHHGIDPSEHPVVWRKEDYFVAVGRVAAEKGTGLAARICAERGWKLKIAGPVGGIKEPAELERVLASGNEGIGPDIAYFRDEVAPYLRTGQIEYIGCVSGAPKDELIGRAKAFLMPIQWEEPFGVAVIDALVCGTPVVAMWRGSMPEIIEHGMNGFLAHTPVEFEDAMERVAELDPLACRRSVEDRFSYRKMARQYLQTYHYLMAQHRPVRMPTARGGLTAALEAARKVTPIIPGKY